MNTLATLLERGPRLPDALFALAIIIPTALSIAVIGTAMYWGFVALKAVLPA